jgi:phosphate transport system substrate-binding protein
MKNVRFLVLFGAFALSFISCNREKRPERTDTTTSGEAEIFCDDCFIPLMREEKVVFEGLNVAAQIKLTATNEKEALNALFSDSVRLIVAARDLTFKEKEMLRAKKLMPRSTKVAIDGVALIINPSNKDSLITVDDFKRILDGKLTSWKQLNPASRLGSIKVVFDNAGSSTVRYVQDSVTKGKIKSPNAFACKNNQEVLEYVSKTPNSLGIIGLNWLNNPLDTAEFSFTDRVRVMSVSPFLEAREDNSYLPYPAYLILKKYPFYRDVYMIISDAPGYLPSGFMNFVAGEKGQRLALKLGLVPANSPMRLVQIHE